MPWFDPAYRLGSEGLAPGDVVVDGGCELRVIATPGHTSDSVCLLVPADDTEALAGAPQPVHTFLNINQLAWPGMLVEVDVIAITKEP